MACFESRLRLVVSGLSSRGYDGSERAAGHVVCSSGVAQVSIVQIGCVLETIEIRVNEMQIDSFGRRLESRGVVQLGQF